MGSILEPLETPDPNETFDFFLKLPDDCIVVIVSHSQILAENCHVLNKRIHHITRKFKFDYFKLKAPTRFEIQRHIYQSDKFVLFFRTEEPNKIMCLHIGIDDAQTSSGIPPLGCNAGCVFATKECEEDGTVIFKYKGYIVTGNDIKKDKRFIKTFTTKLDERFDILQFSTNCMLDCQSIFQIGMTRPNFSELDAKILALEHLESIMSLTVPVKTHYLYDNCRVFGLYDYVFSHMQNNGLIRLPQYVDFTTTDAKEKMIPVMLEKCKSKIAELRK